MTRASRQAGFSVVELATVLVITGIMLAASVPAFTHFMQSNNLHNAAEQVSGHLRLARQIAVSRGTADIAVWNPVDESYRLFIDLNGNGTPEAGEELQGPFTLPIRIGLSNSPTTPFSANQVIFFPNGTASESGAIVLSDDRGNTRRVSVLAPTGQVRLD